MTDWEKQLKRRRGNIRRQELALDDDIVQAHADGLSWRAIGAAAEVNHEWARQAPERIAKRQADAPEHAPPVETVTANPDRTTVD